MTSQNVLGYARSMFEPFIGEITLFAGSHVPTNWALCDGSLLPVAQHTTLYSLLLNTYGGEGTTTFGLPDLPPQGGARYIIATFGYFPTFPLPA